MQWQLQWKRKGGEALKPLHHKMNKHLGVVGVHCTLKCERVMVNTLLMMRERMNNLLMMREEVRNKMLMLFDLECCKERQIGQRGFESIQYC